MLSVCTLDLMAQTKQKAKSVISKSRDCNHILDFKHHRFKNLCLQSKSLAMSSVGRINASSFDYKNKFQKLVVQSPEKRSVEHNYMRMKSLHYKNRRFKRKID